MDIDKDGYIGLEDINTCLRNLNSQAFFKDVGSALGKSTFNSQHKFFITSGAVSSSMGGSSISAMTTDLSDHKILEVCKHIRDAVKGKGSSLLGCWNTIDTGKVGMINFGQFIKGINNIVTVSGSILEKLFSLMDTNFIGVIDFEKFKNVLQIEG